MLNFNLDEQQLLIQDSLVKFFQKDYDFDKRREILETNDACSQDIWSTFANLGWLSIPLSEENGGLGGSTHDLNIVMQEVGKGLLLEPYLESVVMAAKLLEFCGESEIISSTIEKVISGEIKGAVATQEKQSRSTWEPKQTELVKTGDAYQLQGVKDVVVHGQHADFFIVSALLNNAHTLCLVDANSDGVSLKNYRLMDGKVASSIEFNKVAVSTENILVQGSETQTIMQKYIQFRSIALAAEMAGIMGALVEKTADYLKTRKQFGFTLSFFQSLQHRMVDMFMLHEKTLTMLLRATNAFENNDPNLELEICALQVCAADAAKKVGEEAIQLHGGMGMTDELDIGHYAKRLLMINHLYGSVDDFKQTFCQLAYAQ